MIKDSGKRREFDSGAVRDTEGGKDPVELIPTDVMGDYFKTGVMREIACYEENGNLDYLIRAMRSCVAEMFRTEGDTFLQLSRHFEEGLEKYGANNWQKGIPVSSYLTSAKRHYLKWLRGDGDEAHDRAGLWNLTCAVWTVRHLPGMDDVCRRRCTNCEWFDGADCVRRTLDEPTVQDPTKHSCENWRKKNGPERDIDSEVSE